MHFSNNQPSTSKTLYNLRSYYEKGHRKLPRYNDATSVNMYDAGEKESYENLGIPIRLKDF